jgi:hypothetical protein
MPEREVVTELIIGTVFKEASNKLYNYFLLSPGSLKLNSKLAAHGHKVRYYNFSFTGLQKKLGPFDRTPESALFVTYNLQR